MASLALDIRRSDGVTSIPIAWEGMVYGFDRVGYSRLSGGLKAIAFIIRVAKMN